MASGFEVVQADIRAAAEKMGALAEGVENGDPSGEVTPISTAMPGSLSAAAATTLSSTWKTRFSTWGTDASGQETKLNETAADYDASDHAADQSQVHLRRQMQFE